MDGEQRQTHVVQVNFSQKMKLYDHCCSNSTTKSLLRGTKECRFPNKTNGRENWPHYRACGYNHFLCEGPESSNSSLCCFLPEHATHTVHMSATLVRPLSSQSEF
uniref:Uncharacterized protein n=1 Tax=Physcomitrium patens TaxID=3218 RepID=A0A2K1J6K3_PHYPA|nr:hypothetical protein PHYPA_020270 [Physcomitrium patens]